MKLIKKNSVGWGMLLGTFAPLLGLLLFKYFKFGIFTFRETIQFMLVEPGFRTLTVALSLSLLLNALIFTLAINANRDNTAKGIFITTCIYGLFILLVKTIY